MFSVVQTEKVFAGFDENDQVTAGMLIVIN